MEVTVELEAPCTPDELYRWIDDLGRYPEWLDIVPRVEPAEPHPDDAGPAWHVTLRGRLGPLARAKRLRMVRTAHDPPRAVRFERAEHDGRQHAVWELAAEITADEGADGAGSSLLEVHLHYGGRLDGPSVRKLLTDAIARSRPRLLQKISTG